MTNTLNLSRQSKLVPEDKISEYNLKIFGVGSVGSHVAKVAAKTGFRHIEIYDMDTVDEENLAAQAFDFEHLKMNKVDAIADVVKKASGVEVVTHHGQIKEEYQMDAEPNTIYCCFFDSFEGRKMVFDKLKDYPIIFVDGRIGKYDMRHYLIDCSDKEQVEEYIKSLETGASSELVCGEKASAPINVQIAGKIVMNIVCYIGEKDYVKTHISNASAPLNDINIIVPKIKKVE